MNINKKVEKYEKIPTKMQKIVDDMKHWNKLKRKWILKCSLNVKQNNSGIDEVVYSKIYTFGVANYVSMATSQALPRKNAYVNLLKILKITDERMKTLSKGRYAVSDWFVIIWKYFFIMIIAYLHTDEWGEGTQYI